MNLLKMANTYTQIYLHVVFAVSGRACLIACARREKLQKYITGIVSRKGQKLIAIRCMPDHTHVLLGLKPSIAPSDLIGDIKTGSTNHINEQRWIGCKFSWQALAQTKKLCASTAQISSRNNRRNAFDFEPVAATPRASDSEASLWRRRASCLPMRSMINTP